MSRIQLALNVSDIDQAVEFYSKLFTAEPAKRRDGYANFAIDEPPIKLVLIENPDAAGTMNHLGVEVFSTAKVTAAQARLAGDGLATATEEHVTCCYALQDKVWVDDPDGAPWEIYTVLADSDAPAGDRRGVDYATFVGARSGDPNPVIAERVAVTVAAERVHKNGF